MRKNNAVSKKEKESKDCQAQEKKEIKKKQT
jgi:hypothetical protein